MTPPIDPPGPVFLGYSIAGLADGYLEALAEAVGAWAIGAWCVGVCREFVEPLHTLADANRGFKTPPRGCPANWCTLERDHAGRRHRAENGFEWDDVPGGGVGFRP